MQEGHTIRTQITVGGGSISREWKIIQNRIKVGCGIIVGGGKKQPIVSTMVAIIRPVQGTPCWKRRLRTGGPKSRWELPDYMVTIPQFFNQCNL